MWPNGLETTIPRLMMGVLWGVESMHRSEQVLVCHDIGLSLRVALSLHSSLSVVCLCCACVAFART